MTDRRHGQQVIRSHGDIFSKLVKLIVAFGVKREELEEVKTKLNLNHSVLFLSSM